MIKKLLSEHSFTHAQLRVCNAVIVFTFPILKVKFFPLLKVENSLLRDCIYPLIMS